MTPRIAALVPMRHDSERISGKNYRLFNGQPLYRCIVGTLLQCPLIAEVVIDTDSPTIMADARRVFPAVRLLERPAHLRSGQVPMNDVLLHDVTQIDADYYLQTHSTNPLLRVSTVSDAIETFLRGGKFIVAANDTVNILHIIDELTLRKPLLDVWHHNLHILFFEILSILVDNRHHVRRRQQDLPLHVDTFAS